QLRYSRLLLGFNNSACWKVPDLSCWLSRRENFGKNETHPECRRMSVSARNHPTERGKMLEETSPYCTPLCTRVLGIKSMCAALYQRLEEWPGLRSFMASAMRTPSNREFLMSCHCHKTAM